ncbi:hypothetical protein METBIDRAFT_113252 [Metschnikowia bicuspidata var. bicuspidata NRRL YB-4993]|uniref:Uncharacterized protein n=1 Tax=Metschnikowia bicuspidata var. bicuspidata NRRL YB-4993 TaxID=869754 RepID=A0A1A0HIG5_9ASCO|nr:hypothetical protein METBIDRAFT_113252 [Metschnikowia bicuspidata var. bicuspidata NRRL YB-4993]OBA23800.1 hypothetical protein METBIDRAFT_113252 [Metschnikowia bicuspidata var. bicuspidata NRRL YB-4993]
MWVPIALGGCLFIVPGCPAFLISDSGFRFAVRKESHPCLRPWSRAAWPSAIPARALPGIPRQIPRGHCGRMERPSSGLALGPCIFCFGGWFFCLGGWCIFYLGGRCVFCLVGWFSCLVDWVFLSG